MKAIIGILGYARVGKDTLADALGLTKVSFAKPLKEAVDPIARSMGLDPSDPADKEIIRPLYVSVGATARAKDPLHWVKLASTPEGSYAYSDIRYLNEVLDCREKGAMLIWVKRKGVGPRNDEEKRSFSEIRKWMARNPGVISVVHNDGTPEQLARRVRKLIAYKLYRQAAAVRRDARAFYFGGGVFA